MASLKWVPTTTSGGLGVVTVDTVTYTFEPGVPQDVIHDHVSAVTTALQAISGSVVSGPPEI